MATKTNKQTIITTLHRTENVQPWIRREIGWNLRRISQTHDRVSEEFPCEWANNWRVRSSSRRSATTTGDCRIPAHVYERREIDRRTCSHARPVLPENNVGVVGIQWMGQFLIVALSK